VCDVNPARFAELGKQVFGISYDAASAKKAAIETINKMKAFFESIDMPTSISGLGVAVTDEQIKEMAWKATLFGTRNTGAFKSLGVDDIEAIYRKAK
jgi:alcohol dehydrogenase YqhD (iron-dependent ADH family)